MTLKELLPSIERLSKPLKRNITEKIKNSVSYVIVQYFRLSSMKLYSNCALVKNIPFYFTIFIKKCDKIAWR